MQGFITSVVPHQLILVVYEAKGDTTKLDILLLGREILLPKDLKSPILCEKKSYYFKRDLTVKYHQESFM